MNMTPKKLSAAFGILAGALLFGRYASAQLSTPAADPAELEGMYTKSIESRTEEILKPLALTDAAKSNAAHDILISQYRVMRARDALINAQLEASGNEINYSNRAPHLEAESKSLHE